MPAIPDFTQPGWNKALEGRWLRANHQLTFASPSDWGYKNALRDMNDVMATVKAGAMGAQVEKPTPQPQRTWMATRFFIDSPYNIGD